MNKAVLILVGLLFAQTAIAGKAVQQKPRSNANLQTDVRFDNSVVHGKYQTPEDAVARVENEKLMSDLLAIPKHFKGRLQDASGQE